MKVYLLLFVLGSIVFQSFFFFILKKKINKLPILICIATTFSLMLPIELWATSIGLWSWSDHTTLLKFGKIPVEEILLYITSAITTVIIFEFIYKLVSKLKNNNSHPVQDQKTGKQQSE